MKENFTLEEIEKRASYENQPGEYAVAILLFWNGDGLKEDLRDFEARVKIDKKAELPPRLMALVRASAILKLIVMTRRGAKTSMAEHKKMMDPQSAIMQDYGGIMRQAVTGAQEADVDLNERAADIREIYRVHGKMQISEATKKMVQNFLNPVEPDDLKRMTDH